MTPRWARLLTEDDEWVVRTALANVASDLEQAMAAISLPDTKVGPAMHATEALRESAARYRAVLDRIEHS